MKYRPEIDGLRAIAVIPVILFHAGFEQFSGGFIGVDVFFVISGYLITSIILVEMERGDFKLADFYERRARRIFPALFLVMIVSLPFAWFWLLPSDMKDFSQSLIAVSTFSSNFLFWQESGYWGVDNELKPMLHTWSLAVEEQYYVLFPLFLMLMWRYRKRWLFLSFLLFATISLIGSQLGAYNYPTANFFLLPTRAWELAIGASIAFYFLYRKSESRLFLPHKVIDEVLGIIGLMMIGYTIFYFDESVPFPGFSALIPTLGAGLIILFSSEDTLIGRMLGTKIPVVIGLISYSAYLWHQPIFSFARHRSLTELNELHFLFLALLSFCFAYLSWRYVEKPFRQKGLLKRKVIFIFALIGTILFIAIGSAGHFTDGFSNVSFKNNLTEEVIEERLKVNYGLSKKCRLYTESPECRTSDEPEILIWGDSYAMHLVQGVIASNPDSKIIQMTKSVCGPFFDIAPVTKRFTVNWAEGCLEFTGQVRNWIKENDTVKYVVLSSHFNNYLTKRNKLLLRSGELKSTNIDTVTKALNRTINELKSLGVIPVVFSSPPANGQDLGRCLAKAEWMKVDLDECNFGIDQLTQDRRNEHLLLENIKDNYRVIRLDNLMCEDNRCKTHIDSTWLFRDKAHLSHKGSAILGDKHNFYKMILSDE